MDGRATRWGGTARALARLAAAPALEVVLAVFLAVIPAAPAAASDAVTINTTDAYVDPSVAQAFATVPNICQHGLAAPDGDAVDCNKLGAAAVTAAAGIGPDVYFEPTGSYLIATNAFVPQNPGPLFAPSGYNPIFSQHKYDLFGRGEDRMGPLNRMELLFLQELGVVSGDAVSGQTVPGSDQVYEYFLALLTLPYGTKAYQPGGGSGIVFPIAELKTYVDTMAAATGNPSFDGGGQTVVSAWCDGYFSPAVCTALGPQARAINYIFLSGEVDVAVPYSCRSGGIGGSIPQPANCNAREAWMDQTVAGYVQAWDSLGGGDHFAQNFRSQVGYNPAFATLTSGTQVLTDFRLQQSVELSGAYTTGATDPGDLITPGDNADGVAGRQTFEQAFAANSGPGAGVLLGSGTMGQLVAQDIQGYFLSCLNCDTGRRLSASLSHAFTPAQLDLALLPYDAGWNVVPTVIHGQP